jgi:hypothetical protein
MKTAQQWLTELTTGTKRAFPNINPIDMFTGLAVRLQAPEKIHQANASLCGPGSFMYCLASRDPAAYARYVVELYQNGEATLGQLTVRPKKGCRNYAPSTTKGIHPVDWVALAGLRDSTHAAPHVGYDDPSDEVTGITTPRMLSTWFLKSGSRSVADFTSIVLNEDTNCLHAAGNRLRNQYSVCLLIDGDMLATNPDPIPRIANHWVVLTSLPVITKKDVSFTVYNPARASKKAHTVTIDTFRRKFHGYLAAVA